MRDFVFIFPNADLILFEREGLEIVPSFLVRADSLSAAVYVLAKHRGEQGHSSDPEDYQHDIDNGDIEVVCPITIDHPL